MSNLRLKGSVFVFSGYLLDWDVIYLELFECFPLLYVYQWLRKKPRNDYRYEVKEKTNTAKARQRPSKSYVENQTKETKLPVKIINKDTKPWEINKSSGTAHRTVPSTLNIKAKIFKRRSRKNINEQKLVRREQISTFLTKKQM